MPTTKYIIECAGVGYVRHFSFPTYTEAVLWALRYVTPHGVSFRIVAVSAAGNT